MLKNKTILVTGGTGFIGSHLIKQLHSSNKIISVARKPRPDLPNHISQLQLDITKLAQFKQLHQYKLDYVFHTAAAVSYRYPSIKALQQTNVKGTRNLYTYLQKTHKKHRLKKIVHLSSVGVYGPITQIPADETHSHHPVNNYEITKDKSESIAGEFASLGLPLNIIQPTLVYGPGDTSSGMYRLFKVISKNIYFHIGYQPAYMHPLYIDNLTHALSQAARTKHKNKTWIIGDKHYLPLKQIAQIAASESNSFIFPLPMPVPIAKSIAFTADLIKPLGIKLPLTSDTITFATSHRAYSIEKAKTMLHYQPPVTTQTGIKRTINWLKSHGHI